MMMMIIIIIIIIITLVFWRVAHCLSASIAHFSPSPRHLRASGLSHTPPFGALRASQVAEPQPGLQLLLLRSGLVLGGGRDAALREPQAIASWQMP